ncbi:P-loop containing nucleoside triphosphate hydrolase protein [Apiosordaria backusii]|uniref:P-loop containing nucleoside triphosphate hydrolase protein n=1 Tax=Apiosordaria backusii TaxID=314023 RepID=A0AA40EER8_9PEZI|nr:P-loop containing nucleoside triphosphate hydrolase protein [Apiosordaria backusii]
MAHQDPGAFFIPENTGPTKNDIYVFPPEIKGFNLRRKAWVDLDVSKIIEVEWDKRAFKNLVLSKGLILLLHGAPGTGKTFTAEAVAEITEKPLYRVTCGDIGTMPEKVEQYLESVLYLGKIWGCVVLLDEAEVFLEQRGLAIHYDNLNVPQRRKIWRNFLTRLKEIDAESIDSEDIYDNLDEFARMDLNGRAIRNAITTARQLAKHKKEVVNSSHLQYVIEVASRFDDYIKKVREDLTGDELARDGGIR